MELTEKTIKRNTVYEGKIIKVRNDEAELPNGKPCRREVIEHNGGACIAPITDTNSLIFVRQFRYPYMEELLELPAGKLEPGEDPFEAGKRELEEETGCVADRFFDMGLFYPTPGYCGEVIHLYAATGLCSTEANPDEDEFVQVEKYTLEESIEMVLNGTIKDGKTQALILKVSEQLKRGYIK